MSRFRTLATALVAVAAMTMCAMPVFANPGNGNGNGNNGNHGNKGNSGNSQKGNSGSKNNQQSEQRKNYGKPLPPGIAKKNVPASMLNQLPYYPGYEWQVVGDNLVLIALSTAIVASVINGVFD